MIEDQKQFSEYVSKLVNDPKARHYGYDLTVEQARVMSYHTRGTHPKELLEAYRPNEPHEVREYRLQIYEPPTKSCAEKIIHSVNKTLNQRYFTLEFPPENIPGYGSLGEFFLEDYGKYKSIWTWLRETFLPEDFTDANALVCIKPQPTESDSEEYKPLPYIYESRQILDYQEGSYYLIFKGDLEKQEGKVIYIDREVYNTYLYQNGEITLYEEMVHNFGEPPVFFTGGRIVRYGYESFISGVKPHWNKAIRLSSDADGAIVNHLYLEKWEFQTECTAEGCQDGYVEINPGELGFEPSGRSPQRRKCTTCNGTGMVTGRGPYGVYTVNRNALGENETDPIPPGGYIDKNIEPLTKLLEIIETEIKEGFKAVNLEILNEVGANQSGIAKAIDRSDSEDFYLRVSSHLFDYVLPHVIYFTARWIYGAQRSKEQIEDYLFEIVIGKPTEFNILTAASLMDEIKQANESGAGSVMRSLERELVNTRFANSERQRKKQLALVNLKPFPGVSADELLTRNALQSVRKKDLILNDNLSWLVDMAEESNEDFYEKTKGEQLEILYSLIDQEFAEPENVPVEN